MSKLYITRLIALLLLVLSCSVASAADRYTPLPPSLDGSMMPYDFSVCTQIPYLPDSLKPVYAGYVARHGARYLSSPEKMAPVVKALEHGRNTGTLSDTGEALLLLMDQIREANEDNWGDLTPLGYKEERKLAERLHQTMESLSDNGTMINAISSYVPRSVMTMYQFTNGLIRLNDSVVVKTDEGHQFSDLVCCFSADKEFAKFRKDGAWKEVYDDFVERYVSGAPARRLFTHTVLTERQLKELTMDMYEVLKANRAAGLPAPTTQWMSVDEYHRCWKASNLQHYLRNSISPVSSVAANATAPLLRKIIDDTDSAISKEPPAPAVNGYFGHAETLLPLLSLMNIPGCFNLPLDYNDLDECWRVQDITPLGANLLILISRAPSGAHYVALQLNGRTVKPIKGKPDVILWKDLRNYWLDLLSGYEK